MGRFGQICIIQTKKAAIAIRKLPLKPVILNKQSVDSRKIQFSLLTFGFVVAVTLGNNLRLLQIKII